MAAYGKSQGIRRYVSNLPRALEEVGIEIDRFGPEGLTPRWSKVFGLPKAGFALRQSYEHFVAPISMAARSSDLFHGGDSYLPLVATHGPAVVTCHDMTFATHPELHERTMRLWMNRLVWRSFERARLIIADSEVTMQDMVRLGIPATKIRVVYLGVDHVERTHRAPPFGLESGSYICYLGNIEPRKNVGRLLEAFQAARQRLPLGMQLVLAGNQAWGGLPAVPRDIDSDGSVLLTGRVSDADGWALIRNAAVFVYPSVYEGFGLPPLEAMGLGAPSIVGDTPVARELLGDGAHLVDPVDVGAMANALVEVASDDTYRRELRERGTRRASLYTWARAAEETAKVYLEVTS